MLIGRRGSLLLWVPALLFALAVPAAALLKSSGLIVAWVVGMTIRLGRGRIEALRSRLLTILAALSLAMAGWRWAAASYHFYDPVVAGFLGIALFLFMALRQRMPSSKSGPYRTVVEWMSNISYSLYLVHLSLIVYFAHWFPGLVGNPVSVVLLFILCNVVATIFYFLFERHHLLVRRKLDPLLGNGRRSAGRAPPQADVR
jgi:peptidoglycan/LPS O-acetylase OafA/YrhL